MIEVSVSPGRLVVGRSVQLEIRFSNIGGGPCSNIVFTLGLPSGVKLVGGRERVSIAALKAGRDLIHTVTLEADKVGDYTLTSPNFSYRNEEGRSIRVSEWCASVTAEAARPQAPRVVRTAPVLRVDHGHRDRKLKVDEWGELEVLVRNVSDVPVAEVLVAIGGPVETNGKSFRIAELREGRTATIRISVCPDRGGLVPVSVRLNFSYPDGLGSLRRTSQEEQLNTPVATPDSSESPTDLAARMAEGIDKALIKAAKSPPSTTPAQQVTHRRSRPPRVDIALLTILPEEYDAMCEQVEEREPYIGTHKEPNRCDWVTGQIPNSTYGNFRVVVGMVKKGTLGALANTDATINIFRPDHVLVVGVAGAIDRKLSQGDVVVAEHIYGYEYGAVGSSGFEPRPEWTWLTDPALATFARNANRRYTKWRALIKGNPPDGGTREPQVSTGAIASGNKVVDDLDAAAFKPVLDHWKSLVAIEMEAAGACEAVQEALQRNRLLRFSSVRGISDKPLSSTDPSAAAKPGSRADQTAQRDNWKPYASATAAAFTRFLIGDLWPQPPRK